MKAEQLQATEIHAQALSNFRANQIRANGFIEYARCLFLKCDVST